MVKKILDNNFEEVVKSDVAVVDFSAGWCGPCQMLAPVLDAVSEEMEGKADFYNVDVDDNPELAAKYSIMNIPAVLVLKKGDKAGMQVGFVPKPNLKQFIEANL